MLSSPSSPSSPIPLWRHVALAACMFLITAVMGFLQPFVALYLEAAGLTRAQIGLVIGIGPGLALLAQPLLSRLSDRLDTRRPLMAAAAVSSGLAYLSYRAAHGLPTFLLLSALGTNGTIFLGAMGGVLVGRMVLDPRRGGAAYARYRVWGSIGYIVVALLTGWMVARGIATGPRLGRAALAPVFTYGPLLFFAIAVVSLLVPDRRTLLPAGTSLSNAPQVRPGLPLNLRRFLLAYFLYQFALYGASAYISLYLKSLGAKPLGITGTFAAGVVCEVLVMTQVGRFTDHFGRRPALAVAFLLMPLRLLLYPLASTPFQVLLIQTLHGLNFGIMGAIAIVFINDSATDLDRGAAQARLAGVGGLALSLGPAVCGFLAQRYGIGWMFVAMSGVGACGTAVFLGWVRDSHPAPRPLPALLRPFVRLLTEPLGE
ncbi:MAG TPA: MFS transporter [Chthonomonadaceae bacterium]|nr:MFS transporter [Chthonomonadaceae bacterium]